MMNPPMTPTAVGSTHIEEAIHWLSSPAISNPQGSKGLLHRKEWVHDTSTNGRSITSPVLSSVAGDTDAASAIQTFVLPCTKPIKHLFWPLFASPSAPLHLLYQHPTVEKLKSSCNDPKRGGKR